MSRSPLKVKDILPSSPLRLRNKARRICLWVVALTIMPATISLSGCSWLFGEQGHFRDRSMDYRTAQAVPRITVATAERARPIRENLVIPPVHSGGGFLPKGFDDVPRPSVTVKLSPGGEVALNRFNGVDTLLIEKPLAEVEKWLVEYWQMRGSLLNKANPQQRFERAIYLTDWVPEVALKSKRGLVGSTLGIVKGALTWKGRWHRFRITAAPHYQSERPTTSTTEVTIMHQMEKRRGAPSPDYKLTQWSFSDKEDKWLRAVIASTGEFAVEQLTGENSFFASEETTPTEATFAKDGNGYPVLQISKEFAQAWAIVGRALQTAEIKVDDLNRSLAIYYLNLSDDRRFRLPSREATEKGGKPGEEDDSSSSNNSPLGYFELKLSRTESGIQLSLQKDDDTLAPISLAETVLRKVKAEVR